MASFTSRLKDLIDRDGNNPYVAVGLDKYEIFDEDYRAVLNDKIIAHYLNEEIGHETDSMFRQSMRSRMELEMPYFNGLYETLQHDYDPLASVDYTSTTDTTQESNTTAHGNSTSESDSESSSESRNYQYPQQQLNSDGKYMTSAGQADSTSGSTSGGDETSESDVLASGTSSNRIKGRQSSAQSLILAQRETLLNVDGMVVDAVADLFMGIWTTGQAFTNDAHGVYYNGF